MIRIFCTVIGLQVFLFNTNNLQSNVNLETVVEGDTKAYFSIATTMKCREGPTVFPGLLHFTLDPYLILLSVKQSSIKYESFESLV